MVALVNITVGSSETKGKELIYQPKEKGIYRIEAFKGDKGWIFSNHIRIGL